MARIAWDYGYTIDELRADPGLAASTPDHQPGQRGRQRSLHGQLRQQHPTRDLRFEPWPCAFHGVGIALDSLLSLPALVFIPLLAVLVRIHIEEAELATVFGPEYTRYASPGIGWFPASREAAQDPRIPPAARDLPIPIPGCPAEGTGSGVRRS